MNESFRKQDMSAEYQLGLFMDDYFYSRLKTDNGLPVQFERKNDKKSQLQGVDICIQIENRKIYIDEKASIYYSNAMIPTFAFEIDSIQKEYCEPVEGWFVNDELLTQYYMLIWPNVKCSRNKDGVWVRKDISELNKNDFTIVEAMLIKKHCIRAMLKQQGYEKNHLLEYARRIRIEAEKSNYSNRMVEKNICNNVKITLSGQIAEKPVNVVIGKEVLRKMAERFYLISSDGYAPIKT